MTELKPCPFCGGEPKRGYEWHRRKDCRKRYFYVQCSNPYCIVRPKTKPQSIPADAYCAWNRRAL